MIISNEGFNIEVALLVLIQLIWSSDSEKIAIENIVRVSTEWTSQP